MLKRHSEALGLISTSAQLKRVEEMIVGNHKTSRSYSPTQLSNALLDVVTRLADELEARKVYIVNLERDPYVDGNRFAVSVSERFPNAIPDMDEGARCFAFERPTACIFHFMRATEYALNVIAELVGIRAFYS